MKDDPFIGSFQINVDFRINNDFKDISKDLTLITSRKIVFCNLSYVTKKSRMQLFWSCMQHVQLHARFFSCIRQVAKDNFSTSA